MVNAVIHRDYSINDDIHVKTYDHRIEVHSPGKLPGHITKNNILDQRYSRNTLIVRRLHQLPNPVNHDIGEGLNTAYNAMHKVGLVNPEIDEISNTVVITVSHKKVASLEDIILEYLDDDENEWISNKIVRQLSGEDSENKVKKALQKLREQSLIELIDPTVDVFHYRYRKVN